MLPATDARAGRRPRRRPPARRHRRARRSARRRGRLRQDARRTPTCWSSAPARPGSPRPAPAAAAGAPRHARRRAGLRARRLAAGRPTPTVDGAGPARWTGSPASQAELAAAPEVTVLTRTTVFGSYDDNYLVAVEQRDRPPAAGAARRCLAPAAVARPRRPGRARHRRARAARSSSPTTTVPGVMLASAVPTYVEPLRLRCPAATSSSSPPTTRAYATARRWREPAPRCTVVDAARGTEAAAAAPRRSRAGHRRCTPATPSSGPTAATAVDGAVRGPIDADGQLAGDAATLACDLVAVSGGWTPNVTCTASGRASCAGTTTSPASCPAGRSEASRSPAPATAPTTPTTAWPRARAPGGRRASGSACQRPVHGEPVAASAERQRTLAHRAPARRRLWAVPAARRRRSTPTSSTPSATTPPPTCSGRRARACGRSSTSSATPRSAPASTRAGSQGQHHRLLTQLLSGTTPSIPPAAWQDRHARRQPIAGARHDDLPAALHAGHLRRARRPRPRRPVRPGPHHPDAPLARRARRAVRGRRPVAAAVVLPAGRRRHARRRRRASAGPPARASASWTPPRSARSTSGAPTPASS